MTTRHAALAVWATAIATGAAIYAVLLLNLGAAGTLLIIAALAVASVLIAYIGARWLLAADDRQDKDAGL